MIDIAANKPVLAMNLVEIGLLFLRDLLTAKTTPTNRAAIAITNLVKSNLLIKNRPSSGLKNTTSFIQTLLSPLEFHKFLPFGSWGIPPVALFAALKRDYYISFFIFSIDYR